MADYSRYKTETLEKMRDKAYDKYYELTTKPSGNWGDGMRLSKLPQNKEWERVKERLDAIEKELKLRKDSNSNEFTQLENIVNNYVKSFQEDYYNYDLVELNKENRSDKYLWSVRTCGTCLERKETVILNKAMSYYIENRKDFDCIKFYEIDTKTMTANLIKDIDKYYTECCLEHKQILTTILSTLQINDLTISCENNLVVNNQYRTFINYEIYCYIKENADWFKIDERLPEKLKLFIEERYTEALLLGINEEKSSQLEENEPDIDDDFDI